ncbi:hypothetical protein LTR10_020393 [Elasticomyces elasticus]|uniref:BTB domain-containing protein n=1 Tax=Exophiala sideris TaxID=1016849 RepID=A0ABR0JLK7_9EURO|nr:hypothetical protein LTR10_020393 [Elasticomyces elasticus]KAK5036393.1 hypothetical protein LTS07_002120 [Exophiala sideris]KAK5066777.1 hypothetical protein LTR69_002124 [Exophiala sideris]KAK5184835.1 hypothetical protein LTR44_002681 [Eurotiomycetes sp. CCFEE 6388]
MYNAKDANESHPDLYSKSSFLINQTAMVKVIVGKSPESMWMVHEALLTAASRFAAAALSWPCKEQEERTIRLPDEDGAIFGHFVHFLYTRKIARVPLDSAVRLYVLGDRLQALSFRDMVFDKLIQSGMLTLTQLDYAMDNTIPGDRLRDRCLASLMERRDSFFTGDCGSGLSVTKELFRKHSFEILASRMGLYRALVLASGADTDTEALSSSLCSPTPAENNTPVAADQARSLVCNECGKKFRGIAQADCHFSKAGHTDFAESTEEIAP